jgi:hypothetical protein
MHKFAKRRPICGPTWLVFVDIHQSDEITSRNKTFPGLERWKNLPDRLVISSTPEEKKSGCGCSQRPALPTLRPQI